MVDIALKTHRKTITSFKSKFLPNVHTVKFSVTVIPQLGNTMCHIFFIYFKLYCWTSRATSILATHCRPDLARGPEIVHHHCLIDLQTAVYVTLYNCKK